MLDPCIGYQGLRHEAANNTDLTGVEEGEYVKQIEIAKEVLKLYFLDHYVFTSDAASSCPLTDPHSSPGKFDFFADYRVGEEEASPAQEIDTFFTSGLWASVSTNPIPLHGGRANERSS